MNKYEARTGIQQGETTKEQAPIIATVGHGTTETQDSSPVDMEVFLEIAGRVERIPEMARRYTAQAQENLRILQEAIMTCSAANVQSIAHQALGSSAMCGMNSMAVHLRELERMGHEQQLADA